EGGRGGGAREVLGGAGAGHGGGVVQGGAVGSGHDAADGHDPGPAPFDGAGGAGHEVHVLGAGPACAGEDELGRDADAAHAVHLVGEHDVGGLGPPAVHHGDGVGELAARG